MFKATNKLMRCGASQRSFGMKVRGASQASLGFNHADLHELPELDRSFMKVLDTNCDTQSDFYKENYEAMAKVNE